MYKHTPGSFLLSKMVAILCAVSLNAISLHLQAEPLILEEIIVTAQKRTESLTDVPISVAVTTGEKIEQANIVNLEELSLYTPNLYIGENPIGSFIFIRGVGSQTNQGIEQSVATYADGLYRGRMQQSRAPFLDLARIEVLRGPQGILFGKNTIGGAISVISQTPGPEREGSLSVLLGDFDEQEAQLILSGPLTDTLGLRLAIRDYEMEGYLDNLTTGKKDPQRDEQTTRLIMQWDPSDDLQMTLRVEHSEFNSRGRSSQDISNFPFDEDRETANAPRQTLLSQYPDDFANQEEVVDYLHESKLILIHGEFSRNKLDEAVLRMDYQVADHTLTSITGWTAYDYYEHSDVDFVSTPEIQVEAIEDFSQFSQEFRLVSPKGDAFEYIAGIYFQSNSVDYEENDGFAANLLAPTLIPVEFQSILKPEDVPNVNRPFTFKQDSESIAIFGQGTWHLADHFRVIAGLRYSYEQKDARQDVWYEDLGSGERYSCPLDNPPSSVTEILAPPEVLALALRCTLYTGYLNPVILNDPLVSALFPGVDIEAALRSLLNLGTYEHTFDESRSEGKWTPSITLQTDVSDEAMVYFTVTTGYKAGGYDARILLDKERARGLGVDFEFQEEEALNFEIGSKLSFGAAEVNLAVFRTEIDDLQVSIFDGRTGFVVGNAAELLSQGIEVDGRWRFTEEITLSGSMAFLDAQYSSYKDAGCTIAQFLQEERETGSRFTCQQDLSDHSAFIAPEWTASFTALYTTTVFDFLIGDAAIDFNFKDNYLLDTDNDRNLVQGSFTLVNLRFALQPIDGNWSLSLIGKNLTDRRYSPNGADIPLSDGDFYKQTAPPRSYAIQAKWEF